MGYIEDKKIYLEFLNMLRSNDLFSTTTRGVTRKTDTFAAVGGAETFTLTETTALNVLSVKQNGTTLEFGYDYTFTYNTTENITDIVVSKVLIAVDAITVQFDYGASDKINIMFSKEKLSLEDYPRIAFKIVSPRTDNGGFGNVNKTAMNLQIDIYDPDQVELIEYGDALRKIIIDNYIALYYLSQIKPLNTTDLGQMPFGEDLIYKRALEIVSINNYEIN